MRHEWRVSCRLLVNSCQGSRPRPECSLLYLQSTDFALNSIWRAGIPMLVSREKRKQKPHSAFKEYLLMYQTYNICLFDRRSCFQNCSAPHSVFDSCRRIIYHSSIASVYNVYHSPPLCTVKSCVSDPLLSSMTASVICFLLLLISFMNSLLLVTSTSIYRWPNYTVSHFSWLLDSANSNSMFRFLQAIVIILDLG